MPQLKLTEFIYNGGRPSAKMMQEFVLGTYKKSTGDLNTNGDSNTNNGNQVIPKDPMIKNSEYLYKDEFEIIRETFYFMKKPDKSKTVKIGKKNY